MNSRPIKRRNSKGRIRQNQLREGTTCIPLIWKQVMKGEARRSRLFGRYHYHGSAPYVYSRFVLKEYKFG